MKLTTKFYVNVFLFYISPTFSSKHFSLTDLTLNINRKITSRDFTDGGGVEAVRVVAVSRLNEDGGVRQAVSKDLSIDVAQLNT